MPKLQKWTMPSVGIEPASPESNTLTTRPRPLPNLFIVFTIISVKSYEERTKKKKFPAI